MSLNNHKTTYPVAIIVALALGFIVFISQRGPDLIIPTAQLAAVADFDSNLVAHYTFDDGTATDSSGNGNNGTVNGATTTAGQIGQALSFDGVNDYVSLGTTNIPTTGAVSISAWVKIGSSPSGTDTILSHWSTISLQPNRGYFRLLLSGGTTPVFYGLSTIGNDGLYTATSPTALTSGVWTHIVGTTAGLAGTSHNIYINGVLKATGVFFVSYNAPTTNLRLGINNYSDTNLLDGSLDDVRIYNRVLTLAEIQELYDPDGTPIPINGSCGSAAKLYTATETFPQGAYCSAGTASPSSPTNPPQGGSSNWSCLGSNGGTNASCTATGTQAATVTLTITKSGTGSGIVTGPGIDCGSDCTETISSGTSVTLTATPASDSSFTGWSGGDCSGTGSCTVTLNANTTVTATFTIVQTSGEIIPTDRRIDWRPGIPGGIPARTTICATLDAVTHGNGVADATTAIQNAINACPTGQVVYFPAGTYKTTGTISVSRGIVLRGEGVQSKIMVYGAAVGVRVGRQGGGNGVAVSLSGSYAKGATQVTLAQDAAIYAGQYVVVDELNPSIVDTFAASYLCEDRSGNGYSAGQRCISQIVKVVGKNGLTLTLDRPLYFDYSAALNPRVYTLGVVEYAGLEDMKVERAENIGDGTSDIVELYACANCWVKEVETHRGRGSHIQLHFAIGSEIRDNFINMGHNDYGPDVDYADFGYESGRNYGIHLAWGPNTDNLIENNIVNSTRHGLIVEGPGSGNVIAYNYVLNGIVYNDETWNTSSLSNHGAHPYMNLWEGNYDDRLGFDYTHGSGSHNTIFRNRLTHGPAWKTGAKWAIDLQQRQWYVNVVGNVLGLPGMGGVLDASVTNREGIYRFGYSSDGGMLTDPNVVATVLRHGNFDYITNGITWDSNNANHILPASLYLNSKPSWFGNLSWPAFGPEPSNPTVLLNGTIPAKQCFQNQNLANGGVFNPNTCYGVSISVPPPCSSFTYSVWSTCVNSVQTRTVLTSSPSNCTGGNPVLTQSCVVALAPDITPPTVSLASPISGATVSGAAVFLSATASDPASPSGQTSSGIAAVQFKLDNSNIGQELTTPTAGSIYSGSWNTVGIANGSHALSVVARDLAGNRATSTIAVTINNVAVLTPDITPPSVPANFSATAVSASQINLSWSPATDAAVTGAVTSGIASYRIYRGGTLLITVTGTSYSNTDLSASTTYSYTISAFDGAGNSSPESPPVSATTPALPNLTNNPPVPSKGSPSSALAAGATQTTISLITDQAAICKYGVTANLAYNLQPTIFTTTGGATHSTIVANLTNGSTYTYYVRCDSAGSATMGDYIISFSVSAPTPPSSGGGGGGSSGGNSGSSGGSSTPPANQGGITGGTSPSTDSQQASSTPPTVPSLPGSFTPTVPQQPINSFFVSYIQDQKALLKKIDPALTLRLSGQILLQVEERGQAWYVDPISQNRFYLADGAAAYGALRQFGLGITDKDLAKIPVGIETRFKDADTDNDGLADKLEEGLGTDKTKLDTDGDGFSDGYEISQGYDPLTAGKLVYDSKLLNRLKGRIVLQVEKRGQAWYINPADGRRYYLKDGAAAYEIMRYLSLGITNDNIRRIGMGD